MVDTELKNVGMKKILLLSNPFKNDDDDHEEEMDEDS